MKNQIEDISYENGSGKNHSFRIAWRKSFDLVYISFYDEDENDLIFEDELSLTTAMELREHLARIIEAATSKRRKYFVRRESRIDG